MLNANSYPIKIYIAGDWNMAQQACREWAERGACVTVQKCEYIYTGGQESGIIVGMINYPPFKKTPDELIEEAKELANHLKERLHQNSYTIEAPDNTITYGRD